MSTTEQVATPKTKNPASARTERGSQHDRTNNMHADSSKELVKEYLVWCPELGQGAEDGRVVWGLDAEGAARLWALKEDAESADYWIAGGSGTEAVVRSPNGEQCVLRVTGEQTITYSARAPR